jgi:hypothetical protein
MNRYTGLGAFGLLVCLSAALAACLSDQREVTGNAVAASTGTTQYCAMDEDGRWHCDSGGGGGGGDGGGGGQLCPGGGSPGLCSVRQHEYRLCPGLLWRLHMRHDGPGAMLVR